MSVGTIAETKDNLSAILAKLVDGSEREHLVMDGDTPIAVIIPYAARPKAERRFGGAKDMARPIDWEAFDAMDAEIAEDTGL